MPSMTGWEFLDIFQQYSKEVRNLYNIYILSSSVNPYDKDKAERHPHVSGFISKPLSQTSIEKIYNIINGA